MRIVPFVPQAVPVPSLPALVWMGFELWRMRRVMAGLDRARARGDDEAVLRWLHRTDRALADLDRAQAWLRPKRPPRRKQGY